MDEAEVFTSVPVPVASVSRGLAGSLLAITRVLLFWLPTVCGEKVTMIVQLAPFARDPPDFGQVPPLIVKAVTAVR